MHQQARQACSNYKQQNTGINKFSAKSKRNSKIQQTQMTQSSSNTSAWQRTNAQKWQRVTNPTCAGWRLIQHIRHPPNKKPSLLQQGKNLGRMLSAVTRRLVRKITHSNQHCVTSAGQAMMAEYNIKNSTVMVTYDSGAESHYLSEKDRKSVGLPILRILSKKVGMANGSTCKGQYVTALPFPQLSPKIAEADTFDDFQTSLMSVRKQLTIATYPFSPGKELLSTKKKTFS